MPQPEAKLESNSPVIVASFTEFQLIMLPPTRLGISKTFKILKSFKENNYLINHDKPTRG
jgi:hypothetical protein